MRSGVTAPIVLFAYNRPRHLAQTLESLRRNVLAEQSDLYVFSDAARTPAATESVRQVRDYLRTTGGFRSVVIEERPTNLGLAKSVIDGVTRVCSEHGRVIVLEDDMVTSPYFLKFMNEGLDLYENQQEVVSLHGYLYPVRSPLPESFFLKNTGCWGWATWDRGWRQFQPDGRILLDELRQRNLTRAFDFDGTYPFTGMLEAQIRGENDSWAIRWQASAFLRGMLTLYPGRSLVRNIGHDGSGAHCGRTKAFDVEPTDAPIDLQRVSLEESAVAAAAFRNYFRTQSQPGLARRVAHKLRAAWRAAVA